MGHQTEMRVRMMVITRMRQHQRKIMDLSKILSEMAFVWIIFKV